MEWEIAHWNCNFFDDEDDDDGDGKSMGGGQEKGSNAGKGIVPVGPDQCGKDDQDPSEDDNPRALQRLPMCSRTEFSMKDVSYLFGILPMKCK